MSLPPELYQTIADYLDNETVIALSSTNRELRTYISLSYLVRPKKLMSISLTTRLTRLELQYYRITALPPLPFLTYLDISYSPTRFHLPSLTTLIAQGDSVEQEQLTHLVNLTHLDISDNLRIADVTFLPLKTVKVRNCWSDSPLDLTGLSLTSLDMTNARLKGVSTLSNLQTLYANGQSINQETLTKLHNLTLFHCRYNEEIRDVSHLTHLTELNIDHTLVKKLGHHSHLTSLSCCFNLNLTNLPYPSLTKLDIRSTLIDNSGIRQLVNVETLLVSGNTLISEIDHMTKLRVLSACGECGIRSWSLYGLTNLEELHCFGNRYVTFLPYLPKLTRYILSDYPFPVEIPQTRLARWLWYLAHWLS